MMPTKRPDKIKHIIEQALEFINSPADTEQELSEEQLDLVVAGVTVPEYRQFIQTIWERRREKHGREADR